MQDIHIAPVTVTMDRGIHSRFHGASGFFVVKTRGETTFILEWFEFGIVVLQQYRLFCVFFFKQ